jgi:RNA polymerase primary sigma factor
MPVEKVRKILNIAKEPINLETRVGAGEYPRLGDSIKNNALHKPKHPSWSPKLRNFLDD